MPASYFASLAEYYVFAAIFIAFILSELVIKIYAHRNRRRAQANKKFFSLGALFVMLIGLIGCFRLYWLLSNNRIPVVTLSLRFPSFFYFLGLLFMLGGTVLRGVSVRTLQHAFTVVVQTTAEQKLIKHGVYKLLRNPSYTGIILFIVGVTFSLLSVVAAIVSVILCAVGFGIRIKHEEKALRARFGQEFDEYCMHTWRLIPFLW